MWRRKRLFQLAGLASSSDGLYDGSFVRAVARWWNYEMESSQRLREAGYRALSAADVDRLQEVVQPENRVAFEELASSLSMPGRQSNAVLCLAYAFALVIDVASAQPVDGAGGDVPWTQARPLTRDDLVELARHYSQEGVAREYALWAPYWLAASTAFPERIGAKLINSLRATFDDQVDRWSVAEGLDLRKSVGAPDYSMIAFDENAGPPTFVDLLFDWGGRLRLGERILAAGAELSDERFDDDELDPINHLYAEAFDRYVGLASQSPPPISGDVEVAVRMCVEWFGDDLDDQARLGISTAAIRAYLWRTVENGPIDFLEPGLTEAVARSLEVGDDRSIDEPASLTYYYAASQCMLDNVHTRFGSVGGLFKGPRSFERAFWDTADDFDELGLALDEGVRRRAFTFGVCLADVERVLKNTGRSELARHAS